MFDFITFVGDNLLTVKQISEFNSFYETLKIEDAAALNMHNFKKDKLVGLSGHDNTTITMSNKGVKQLNVYTMPARYK